MLLEVSNVDILRWDLLSWILYSPPCPMALHAAAKPWKHMSLWLNSLFSHSLFNFVVVQSLSYVRLFANPWTAGLLASLSFSISWSLLKLMSIESVMPSHHLSLCHLLLLLPSIFPSISLFQWVGSLCQVAKILELKFSCSISPFSEYSGCPTYLNKRYLTSI